MRCFHDFNIQGLMTPAAGVPFSVWLSGLAVPISSLGFHSLMMFGYGCSFLSLSVWLWHILLYTLFYIFIFSVYLRPGCTYWCGYSPFPSLGVWLLFGCSAYCIDIMLTVWISCLVLTVFPLQEFCLLLGLSARSFDVLLTDRLSQLLFHHPAY